MRVYVQSFNKSFAKSILEYRINIVQELHLCKMQIFIYKSQE